jgi:ribosomal protein S16
VNEERAQYWLSVGAQPSDTVAGLLTRAGVITAKPAAQPTSEPIAATPAAADAVS